MRYSGALMTLATKITVFRLAMVPVFVAACLRYAATVSAGAPVPFWRWFAVVAFASAALSDALDGYIARRYHQRSRLGTFLDPIADKALMLSALLALSFADWGVNLPLWYAALVIARDLIQVSGAIAVGRIAGDIRVVPHWTGKLATGLQILAISAALLMFPAAAVGGAAAAAAIFTTWSAVLYIGAGLTQLPEPLPAEP